MELLIILITGVLIGGLAGCLGSLMVGRRISLIGGPLGHLALPGIAIALHFQFDIFFGGLASILLGIILIWALKTKTSLSIEALTGIVFAVGVGLGFLILPLSKAEEAVIGNIRNISVFDLLLSSCLALFIFLVLRKNYSRIALCSISEDLARGRGINIKKINFVLLFMIAVITALEVKIIGVLLTTALFVIPASAARNIGGCLRNYLFFSIFFGLLSAGIGIGAYKFTGLPAGPLIILTTALLFAFSVFVRKKT